MDWLRIDGLRFAWDGADAPLFDGWSVSFRPGLGFLYGDSGAGKTTLFRLLTGELPIARGVVTLGGQALAAGAARRAQLAWIDPGNRDFDALSVSEFVDRWASDRPAFDRATWERHLEGFALGPHRDKRFEQLSTGSRRKFWISATLASGAPLMLFDEPTAALDRPSIDYLWRALAEWSGAPDRLALVASFVEPSSSIPFDTVVTLPA